MRTLLGVVLLALALAEPGSQAGTELQQPTIRGDLGHVDGLVRAINLFA